MNKDKVKIFKLGNAKAFYIPATIRNDSTYPFKEEEDLFLIEIVKESLVIRRLSKDELNN
jgi:hypothetical protein